MKRFRKYGDSPFNVVVVHGGPGAAGEMAPVAKEISTYRGVLEPFQTANSLEGQIEELRSVCEEHGAIPVTLVGYSWGAWLVFILASRYPALVKKLILVESGPFEAEYAKNIMDIRLSRLNQKEKNEAQELLRELGNSATDNKSALKKFGKLISKTDAYDPLPDDKEKVEVQQSIYQGVWPEASELRKSGKLLQLGLKIQCSVVAIHGDYDPHPAEGIKGPLSKVIKDFRFILLEKCGHKPWIERNAKDKFYETLKNELD